MAMTLTRDQLEHAELLVVVDPLGNYQWSSARPAEEVADFLERMAEDLRTQTVTTDKKD